MPESSLPLGGGVVYPDASAKQERNGRIEIWAG